MPYPELQTAGQVRPDFPDRCPVCGAPQATADALAVTYACQGAYQRIKEGWPCSADIFAGSCPTEPPAAR